MASKLCPHVLVDTADALQMVEAGSPLIKLVSGFGLAGEIHRRFPHVILLGRVYEGGEHDATRYYRDGLTYPEAARRQVERQRQQYELNPLIKIWEGPNEQVFGDGNDPENLKAIAWYGQYETERLRLLHDMGLRGCVGNFSTGNPDLPERDRMAMWRAFLPAVEAAKQYDGFLGLHEYSSPWMWYMSGKYQKPSHPAYDNPAVDAGRYGWLTFRYRMIYDQLLIPRGLGDVPLILTEFGLDRAGDQPPGVSSGPWRSNVEWWRTWGGASDPIDYWRGPERDPERYYAEQLIWIDGELQKDPYVVGATVFTLGSYADFAPFDIAGTRVVPILCEHIRREASKPATSTVATPKPAAADGARFVADVTIPDGTPLPAGTSFVKTWRVRNTGTSEWTEQYALVFFGGEAMGGPARVPLAGRVAPGAEVELSVPLVAPAAPGLYVSRWRLHNAGGQSFGFNNSSLTAVVNVPASSVEPASVAPQVGTNLLMNSSFEAGIYYADNTRELGMPSGWTLWFADGGPAERLPGQAGDFKRPMTVLLDRTTVAPSERALYLADRDRSLRISASQGPTWAAISQGLSGLKVGRTYRFTARILPDLAASLTPQKTYPTDPLASEVRLVAECGGQIFETGWRTAAQVPFGRYSPVSLEFTAADRNARVKVEVRTRIKVQSGGWAIDALVLEPA